MVTTTDDTEYVSARARAASSTWRRSSKNVAKAQDAGKKGATVKMTHEKGVASKIESAEEEGELRTGNRCR